MQVFLVQDKRGNKRGEENMGSGDFGRKKIQMDERKIKKGKGSKKYRAVRAAVEITDGSESDPALRRRWFGRSLLCSV